MQDQDRVMMSPPSAKKQIKSPKLIRPVPIVANQAPADPVSSTADPKQQLEKHLEIK